jgi:hypothetical protein
MRAGRFLVQGGDGRRFAADRRTGGIERVEQAIKAYRQTKTTDEFKELERLHSRARHNEASALYHAEREAEKKVNKKWQTVVAENATALAEKDALIAELREQLGKGTGKNSPD